MMPTPPPPPSDIATGDVATSAPSPGAGLPFQRLDLCEPAPYSRSEYVRRFLWHFVQATLFHWSFRRAFRWRRALLRAFGAKLGPHVFVRAGCQVFHPWLLETGDWVSLADEVVVYNLGPIIIGSHTTISQGAYLCAGTHDYTQVRLPLMRPPIRIGNGVWIAAQAFIGPGATVGDNSVIGARAVVFGKIPAGVIAAGNPAKVLKERVMMTDNQKETQEETPERTKG